MAASMPSSRIRGVLAPVLTPFTRTLDPDIKHFVAFCRVLSSLDIGLVPFGSASEGTSLGTDEKIAMLDAMTAAGLDMSRVMPSIGSCSLMEAARLAAQAVDQGCCGVLVLPPFYYKNITEDGLFRFYADVIQRVGDNRLRLYLCHIPRHTQIPLSLSLLDRLVKAYPSVVVGIKDNSGEWSSMQSILSAFPGFDVFSGSETSLLKLMRAGGTGCIAPNANVNGAAMVELMRRWREPGAESLQEALVAFRVATQDFPMIAALKALVARACGDVGWRLTRPPLMDLSIEAEDEMVRRLERAGFPV